MQIIGSPNISNLDFEFQLDISQPVPKAIITDISTYIGAGTTNIIGLVVRIIDPSNLALPQTVYPPNVDIYPGLTSTSKNLPYFNGQVKWGVYKAYITLIDADGTQYAWSDSTTGVGYKSINLCKPNSLSNATLNYGGLNLDVNPDCDTGMLIVQDGGTGFSYNGVSPSETVTALTITYPVDTTGTTAQVVAPFIPFTFPLTVSGIYSIVGTVTQTYQLTETTSVKVSYYYQNTFDVQCGYSLCKALCDYEKLLDEVKSCSPANPNILFQKLKTLLLITGLLVKSIAFKNCGKKFGDLLEQFRIIGGFSCNCECAPQGIAPAPLGMGGGTLVKGNMCGDIDLTLTQFLGNVKIDASDISYDVQAAADQSDFITITPSEGTCSKTFTISIDFAAAIEAAAFTICIENTAFVTPCGDDATGEIGNFLLPFETIKGAVAATTSNDGNHVHVYPGTYAETQINVGSDAVEKTGLNYYFEPGVIINSSGNMFAATAIGTTIIRGAGILNATSAVIDSAAAVNWDIECISMNTTGASANCIFIYGGGTFRLKCSAVTSTGAGCIDIRTIGSTGYVECDLFDNQNSALSGGQPCVKINSAVLHEWTFYVKELYTKSDAVNNGAGIVIVTAGSLAKIYWKGNIHQTNVAASGYSAGIATNAGLLIFEGDITSTTGHGITCTGGQIMLKNATVRSLSNASAAVAMLNPPGTGLVIANNCMFINNSDFQPTIAHQSSDVGSVQLSNCLITNENAAAGALGIALNNVAQAIRLNNTNIYLVSATGVSITTTVAVNSRIINCWSNRPVGGVGVITNLIQAINVDSDVLHTIY